MKTIVSLRVFEKPGTGVVHLILKFSKKPEPEVLRFSNFENKLE
jgi:hypothetical protein